MEMTEVQYEASILAKGEALLQNNFPAFRKAVHETIEKNLAQYGAAIFTTSTKHLSSAYVSNFEEGPIRQHHDCACCRDFIRTFGTTVVIGENGRPLSLMWDPEVVPEEFKASVAKMKEMAERGVIRQAVRFDIHGTDWGFEMKNGWNHLYYNFDKIGMSGLMKESGVSLAAMSTSKENFNYLRTNIERFPAAIVRKGAQLLASGRITRNDKFADWVNWILDINERYEAIPAKDSVERNAVIWAAVIRLPAPGWASYAGSMPGMMFEMIEDDRADAAIVHRFNQAADPLNHQRQTKELSAGQAQNAEKLIFDMGLAPALQRRFATYEEVRPLFVWERPAPQVAAEKKDDSIFGGLVGKKPGEADKPAEPALSEMTKAAPMNLMKFFNTVLPEVLELQLYASAAALPISQFIGPAVDDAPAIFRYDKARRDKGEAPFPICWNQRHGGVSIVETTLSPGWQNIKAVAKAPWMIDGETKMFGHAYGFILEGAKSHPTSYDLFPEVVLSELHPVRGAIEALNTSKRLEAGLDVVAAIAMGGAGAHAQFKVRTKLGWMLHTIDRFD